MKNVAAIGSCCFLSDLDTNHIFKQINVPDCLPVKRHSKIYNLGFQFSGEPSKEVGNSRVTLMGQRRPYGVHCLNNAALVH